MKRMLILIVYCLVLSLVIQNTCPFGAAGKSSVVPKCGHCPLMQHSSNVPQGAVALASDSPSHFPLFLFTAVKLNQTFQLELVKRTSPLLALNYPEDFPSKLLKPPQA
jgi:hypothetical protein